MAISEYWSRLFNWSKRATFITFIVLIGLLVYILFNFRGSLSNTPIIQQCECALSTPFSGISGSTSSTILSASLKPISSNVAKRFPHSIIIGVRKGGTRALIDMLNSHPDISAAIGEVHYFDREDNFSRGVQWYIDRMPYTKPDQVTIEKSPSYFISKDVPLRMYMVSRNLKLILIVREPVERTISDFSQLDAKKEKKDIRRPTFEELAILPNGEVATSYLPISVSMYDVHIEKWLKYFDMDHIHIVNGDTLVKDPAHELERVEDFLGVSRFFNRDMFLFNETKGFYCWKKRSKRGSEIPYCLGSGKGRKHPTVSNEVISKLKTFFRLSNERFFNLTGQDMGWNTLT